jgi:hypothetical protein
VGYESLKIPELPSIKCISEKVLAKLWRNISDKPLPEVYAYTLNNKDFDYLLNLLQKNPGVKDSRVREYGVDFDNRFIEACSFRMNEGYFVVLVKQSAPLQISLEHELNHILNDDYST